jgi:colanic acid biosynthesis glycosyl transferase WcaI
MRILIVTIYYSPEPVPKPHELAEGLARRGHHVTVLTAFPTYPEGKFYPGYDVRWRQVDQINGVRVVRLPVYPDHSARARHRVAHVLSFFLAVLCLGPWLSGKFDIAYVWGNPPTSGVAGWLISRLRGARFVYGVHDLWPELAEESGMIRGAVPLRILGAVERFVLSRADLVLPISEGFRESVIQKGVAPTRVLVIPHWADDRVYHPAPRDTTLAEQLGIGDCFVIVYAGNIGRLQGLAQLVEAAGLLRAEMPRLRLLMIGDGVERERLRQMALQLGASNIQFIDRMSPQDVVRHCALADALYLGLADTKLARLSVPSKLPTYLACGRPVIANVPGETAAFVERHGFGVNCAGATAAAIAEAVRIMADASPEIREAMSARALNLFRTSFRMETLLDQHDSAMRSVLLSRSKKW